MNHRRKQYHEPVILVVVVMHVHTVKYIRHRFTEAPEEGDVITLSNGQTLQGWKIIKTFPEHINASLDAIMTLMTEPVFDSTHTLTIHQ